MTGRRARWLLIAAIPLAFASCDSSDKADGPEVAPTTTILACDLEPGRCPNPHLTPGQVTPQATTIAAVCPVGGPGRDPRRQLTAKQEAAVLAAYQYPAGTRVAEWDHLIGWWAGGTSTPANVWPTLEPLDQRRKDGLEARLYRQVCTDHTMLLAAAQERMRHYWLFW